MFIPDRTVLTGLVRLSGILRRSATEATVMGYGLRVTARFS